MNWRAVTALVSALCASPAMAQWVTSGVSDIRNSNAGAVGVNVAPSMNAALEVNTDGVNVNFDYGIWVENPLDDGYGVFVNNTHTSSTYAAVRGVTASTVGTGVAGISLATTGTSFGIYGEANAPNGTGVVAINNASTDGYALYAFVASNNGYAVWAEGARNYFEGDVAIGVAGGVPTAQLHVDGTVRLQNIPLATGTVTPVMIDTNGNIGKLSTSLPGREIKEFTSSTTWTIPTGVTKVKFRIWGGGGAGTSGLTTAAPGGSGGYGEGIISLAGLSGTLSITVGAGGATAGTSGGASSISHTTPGLFFQANGGTGGSGSTPGAGGGFTNNCGSNTIARNGLTGVGTTTGAAPPLGEPVPPAYAGEWIALAKLSGSGSYYASPGAGGPPGWAGARGAVVLEW